MHGTIRNVVGLMALMCAALPAFGQTPQPIKAIGQTLSSRIATLAALETSIALDWRSTVTCSNAGTCREANPILIAAGAVPGTADGTRRFTYIKGGEMVVVAALYLWATHKYPQQSKAFVLEAWTVTAGMSVLDAHNRTLYPKVR